MARKKFTKNDFRRALRKVRTKLLNGKITKEQFQMDIILATDPNSKRLMCGTRACIGGHMAIELNKRVVQRRRMCEMGISARGPLAGDFMDEAVALMPNLRELFYGYPIGDSSDITRRSAAAAITRALDGKRYPWSSRGK